MVDQEWHHSPGNLCNLSRLHDEPVGVRLLLIIVCVPRARGPGTNPAYTAGPQGLRGC